MQLKIIFYLVLLIIKFGGSNSKLNNGNRTINAPNNEQRITTKDQRRENDQPP